VALITIEAPFLLWEGCVFALPLCCLSEDCLSTCHVVFSLIGCVPIGPSVSFQSPRVHTRAHVCRLMPFAVPWFTCDGAAGLHVFPSWPASFPLSLPRSIPPHSSPSFSRVACSFTNQNSPLPAPFCCCARVLQCLHPRTPAATDSVYGGLSMHSLSPPPKGAC
jgi:hypothetical protein